MKVNQQHLHQKKCKSQAVRTPFCTSKQPHPSFTWRVSARIFFCQGHKPHRYRRQRGGKRWAEGPAEAGRSGPEAGAAQRGRTVRAASHQRAEDLHSVHILPLPWIFFVKGVFSYAPENP